MCCAACTELYRCQCSILPYVFPSANHEDSCGSKASLDQGMPQRCSFQSNWPTIDASCIKHEACCQGSAWARAAYVACHTPRRLALTAANYQLIEEQHGTAPADDGAFSLDCLSLFWSCSFRMMACMCTLCWLRLYMQAKCHCILCKV